jgi:hypothetical protein
MGAKCLLPHDRPCSAALPVFGGGDQLLADFSMDVAASDPCLTLVIPGRMSDGAAGWHPNPESGIGWHPNPESGNVHHVGIPGSRPPRGVHAPE